MALWKQMLADMDIEEEEVTILDEDVTGVKSDNDGPDELFYSEFGEEEAKAFFDIFTIYKSSVETNRFANETLEGNLKEQIRAMRRGVNPIEVVLYASRCVKDYIYNDLSLRKMLNGIIVPQLRFPDRVKIAEHILGGWEWLAPVCVFIEAIGNSNIDELIKLAMKYFPHFARMGKETNEHYIFTAYLNMIFATQNNDYNDYLIDIASNYIFAADPDLTTVFLNKLKKARYLNSNSKYTYVLSEISARAGIPAAFRIKIDQILKNSQKESPSAWGSVSSDVEELSFGRFSRKDIITVRNIRDDATVVQALHKVMENIENIYPEEQRGDAYVLFGTKGTSIREEAAAFLKNELESNPKYKIPIYIALQGLLEVGSSEVLQVIAETPYEPFWVKNIANYCRYNSSYLGAQLLPFFASEIETSAFDERVINRYLRILSEILNIYNSGAGKLSSDTFTQDGIFNLLNSLNAVYGDREIYEKTLEILSLLGRACPSRKSNVLERLDRLQKSLKNQPELKTIEQRVTSLIGRLDTISAPQ